MVQFSPQALILHPTSQWEGRGADSSPHPPPPCVPLCRSEVEPDGCLSALVQHEKRQSRFLLNCKQPARPSRGISPLPLETHIPAGAVLRLQLSGQPCQAL